MPRFETTFKLGDARIVVRKYKRNSSNRFVYEGYGNPLFTGYRAHKRGLNHLRTLLEANNKTPLGLVNAVDKRFPQPQNKNVDE